MRSLAARIAAAVFVVLAVVGAVAVLWLDRLEQEDRRTVARGAVRSAALGLEDQLDGTLAAGHALAAIVRQSGRIERFDAVAAEMLRVYDGASALQLAPDGVITDVHPLAGNEAAVGLRLFELPVRRESAIRARDSRSMTLDGPFALAQSGLGLVGRYPVFRREGDGERFWGFAAVVIRLEPFLARSGLETLGERGYAWTLAPEEGPPFAASEGRAPQDPVRVPVHVPGATWTIAAAPRAGWTDPWAVAGWLALTLVLAAALALGAHRIVRQPELLARLVAERTAELEQARAGLERELSERHRAEAAQRAAEAQAREAQRLEAVGQLAGGVAHDFNNLLVGIIGWADLLSEPDPPVAEAARGIREAATRAAELTRQLLGLARRGKFVSAAVDLAALVREVARLLERTVDKRIAIDVHAGKGPVVVQGDPGQLQQVILNLAVNARDAMREGGGTLTLETSRVHLDEAACRALPGLQPGPHVALRVVDTGAGIPEALRPRIFEPFFTTKEPGQGTGLGLAVVHGIVRNHGGAIAFEPRPGGGTCFTLHLPAHDGVPEAPAHTPAPARRRGTVLVVDDERVVREAAGRLLASLGYEPHGADGADEAVRLLEAGVAADVALVDLQMPGRDGVECLAAMRRVRPGLVAVLSSGFADDRRVQTALQAGFAGFLYKPYGMAELAEALRRALDAPPPAA